MQESIVKLVLSLLAVLFLALGGVFLIIPEWYITFSEAQEANTGWLRGLGAAMVSVQGVGLSVSAFRRRDTNPLLATIALASTAQAGVLWYSLVAGEFTVQALWTLIVPGVVVTLAAILGWAAWASRHQSVKLFVEGREGAASGRSSVSPSEGAAQAPGGDSDPGVPV